MEQPADGIWNHCHTFFFFLSQENPDWKIEKCKNLSKSYAVGLGQELRVRTKVKLYLILSGFCIWGFSVCLCIGGVPCGILSYLILDCFHFAFFLFTSTNLLEIGSLFFWVTTCKKSDNGRLEPETCSISFLYSIFFHLINIKCWLTSKYCPMC